MPVMQLFAVALGGALGSVVRAAANRYALVAAPAYPGLGTLCVNVVGSLLIGFLVGQGGEHRWLSMEWRMFLVTGVLGGLTTFSSLTLETWLLSRHPHSLLVGGGHLAANLVLGLLAVSLGERIATWWTATH